MRLGLWRGRKKGDERGKWACDLHFEERTWKEQRLGSGTGSCCCCCPSSSMAKPVEGEIGANSFFGSVFNRVAYPSNEDQMLNIMSRLKLVFIAIRSICPSG